MYLPTLPTYIYINCNLLFPALPGFIGVTLFRVEVGTMYHKPSDPGLGRVSRLCNARDGCTGPGGQVLGSLT